MVMVAGNRIRNIAFGTFAISWPNFCVVSFFFIGLHELWEEPLDSDPALGSLSLLVIRASCRDRGPTGRFSTIIAKSLASLLLNCI